MGNAVSGRKLNSDMMLELESFLEANALCNSSVLGPSGLEKMIKEARLMEKISQCVESLIITVIVI